jgi:hypothetical protein
MHCARQHNQQKAFHHPREKKDLDQLVPCSEPFSKWIAK